MEEGSSSSFSHEYGHQQGHYQGHYHSKPSLKELCRHSEAILDHWKDMALELDLPWETINRINRDNILGKDKCFNMFYTWLERSPDPCWCQIVEAIKKLKLLSVAKNIEEEVASTKKTIMLKKSRKRGFTKQSRKRSFMKQSTMMTGEQKRRLLQRKSLMAKKAKKRKFLKKQSILAKKEKKRRRKASESDSNVDEVQHVTKKIRIMKTEEDTENGTQFIVEKDESSSVKLFEKNDVEGAFLYLLVKLEEFWDKKPLSKFQKVCLRDTRLPPTVKEKIKTAPTLSNIITILTNTVYCTWIEIRILDRMANVAEDTSASNLIKVFQKTVYSKPFIKVARYVKKHYIHQDHVAEVTAKLNKDARKLLVQDLVDFCNNLEGIMQNPPSSTAFLDGKPGCLEISMVIPMYCYLHAYEIAKHNGFKLRQLHFRYVQIGSYPKIYAVNSVGADDISVEKIPSTGGAFSPSQVISHYYTFLEGHMDADSVSHVMLCKQLITDGEYEIISTAPNDRKMNSLILQFVKSMNISNMLKFCDILKDIETQKSIGQELENSLQRGLQHSSLKIASVSGKMKWPWTTSQDLSHVHLMFFDLVDELFLYLLSSEKLPFDLFTVCLTILASKIHDVPLFSKDYLKKMKYPHFVKLSLLLYMNWLDHSLLKMIVSSSKDQHAIKLVNDFDLLLDKNKPIIEYPIPEPSQFLVPLYDRDYTLVATKCCWRITDATLQQVIEIKSLLVSKWDISECSIQLVALHVELNYLYWLIPKTLVQIIQKQKLKHEVQQELHKNGIIITVIFPSTAFTNKDDFRSQTVAAGPFWFLTSMMQSKILDTTMEFEDELDLVHKEVIDLQKHLDDNIKLKDDNIKLKDDNIKLKDDTKNYETEVMIKKRELDNALQNLKTLATKHEKDLKEYLVNNTKLKKDNTKLKKDIENYEKEVMIEKRRLYEAQQDVDKAQQDVDLAMKHEKDLLKSGEDTKTNLNIAINHYQKLRKCLVDEIEAENMNVENIVTIMKDEPEIFKMMVKEEKDDESDVSVKTFKGTTQIEAENMNVENINTTLKDEPEVFKMMVKEEKDDESDVSVKTFKGTTQIEAENMNVENIVTILKDEPEVFKVMVKEEKDDESDVSVKTLKGTAQLDQTPLHRAVESGSEDMVKFLVEKGANVNFVDGGGRTPLYWAVEIGSEDMVKFLVEKGANVNVVDGVGRTPLHWAVESGSEDMVKFLVDKGANVNVVDYNNKTPFELAVEEDQSGIVSYFFKELHVETSQFDEEMKKKISLLLDKASGQDTSTSHDTTSSANTDHLSVEDVTEGYMDGELLGPDVRVALFGAEGSGKTCLSHTLVGKDYQDTPPTEGADHMEIVVESTTDWQPLTDEQKLDHLEQQKCLEAMYMSATRQRQPASIATSSYMSSTLPVMPAAIPGATPSTLPHCTPASRQTLYLSPTLLSSMSPSSSGRSFPAVQPISLNPSIPSFAEYPSKYSASGPSQGTSLSKRMSPPISKKQKMSTSKLSHHKNELLSIKKFQSLKAIREKYNPNKKYINIWDFAGQAVFQHTHGIFVSEHVVCLIVFDASLSLDEVPLKRYPDDHTPRRTVLQTICYWMELISSRVSMPSTSDKDHSVRLPTFILVGTHIDKLHPDIAIAEAIAFTKFVPLFKKELTNKPFSLHLAGSKKDNLFKRGSPSLFFVCNQQQKRIPEIINALKRVVIQSASITRQTRPTRYVEVERKLMLLSIQEKVYIIGLTELAEVAKSCGLPTKQEALLKVSSYLHHKGALLHFHEVPSLANTIILSPHWMAKLLTYVLTDLTCWPANPQLVKYAERRQKEGLLEEELIDWSVEQFNKSESSSNRIIAECHSLPVVELFIKFLLIVDITQSSLAGKKPRGKRKRLFLVPHLLPFEELPPSKMASFKFLFYFPGHFIPDNLVDQLIVKCVRWNDDRHHDLLRLSYQWVCLNLGQYQVYTVKPVDQHHYIELTIIPDPAMPPGYEVESYKESRELITAVKEFIDDLMKEHMTAIVEESPVECFIACPCCDKLHIKLEIFCATGNAYCPTRRDYCSLPKYHKILSTKADGLTHSTTTSLPTPNQKPIMRLLKEFVIPKMAAKWKDVADFLDYDLNTVDIIEEQCKSDYEKCSDKLFRDWLSTSHGVEPKTWTTLLMRMKRIPCLAVATSDIEQELGFANN